MPDVPPLPAALLAGLTGAVPASRVLTRPVDRIAFASDASFYRLVPQAVVLAASVDEVRALFGVSQRQRVPLTFRAAGTSLSGQAVTDGILVEVARHWKRVAVEDNGRRVRVQPGAIGGHVNARLAPFGARIGPDPASINACTMGGILANNSSGMCCGVVQNAYHTVESLTFVLPSGTVIDTAWPGADDLLRAREPALADGLLAIKHDIEARPALRDRIRAKYRMKNTMGYSLNAFLDGDRPVDILRRLLIGSEGTLAFVAEAVLRTVPDLPVRYTGLLLFPDLHTACSAIGPLREAGASALELMDRAALRSVDREPGVPDAIRALPPGAAGLLVELQAAEERERRALERQATEAVGGLRVVSPPLFTHDAGEQARLWTIRKGMFPSVGAVRRSGTTVIIEDVAFPVEALADAAVDLTRLFVAHGYPEAIIFGHAKDGNLHFVLTQSFNTQAAIDQYARFMDEVVRLVVGKYDGALKAEHGTGRNMAPFVDAEWGPEAAAIMARVKSLVDPHGLLNPGVIVNRDPRAHLADLKPLPTVEEEVDRCIECGYCEPLCPSRQLSFSPRQRIGVRREIVRRRALAAPDAVLDELEAAYPYLAVDTCAADGLCATACPVHIDTGQLMKRFRGEAHAPASHGVARWCAEHFDLVESGVRHALRAGHLADRLLGTGAVTAVTRGARRIGGRELPLWSADVPHPAPRWDELFAAAAAFTTDPDHAAAVYVPACLTRVMGRATAGTNPAEAGSHVPPAAPADPRSLAHDPSSLSIVEAIARVAARAGRPVYVPFDAPGFCCGVPFSSKGYSEAHALVVNRSFERLWAWSGHGRLPIVIDTSPCAYGLQTCRPALTPENQACFDRLSLLDIVSFLHGLLPRLATRHVRRHVALHPVCSLLKAGLADRLAAIAGACADRVLVPWDAGCCGFAGDRGFLVPELTAAATAQEAAEVRAQACDGHYSSSRTCEIGLSRATGEEYESIVFLVEEATRDQTSRP